GERGTHTLAGHQATLQGYGRPLTRPRECDGCAPFAFVVLLAPYHARCRPDEQDGIRHDQQALQTVAHRSVLPPVYKTLSVEGLSALSAPSAVTQTHVGGRSENTMRPMMSCACRVRFAALARDRGARQGPGRAGSPRGPMPSARDDSEPPHGCWPRTTPWAQALFSPLLPSTEL